MPVLVVPLAVLTPVTIPLPAIMSRLNGGRGTDAEDAGGDEESLMVLFKTSEGGLIVVKMMDGLEPGREAIDGDEGDSAFG